MAGTEFDLAVLHRVVAARGEDAGAVLTAVSEASAAGVLEVVSRTATRYRFRELAEQERLAGHLPVVERAVLHGQIGEALERTGAPVAQVAAHLLEAAPVSGGRRAVAAGRRAAEEASARGALDEAVRFCRRALEALAFDPTSDAAARGELLVELGTAEVAAGDLTAALESLSSAVGLAERLPRSVGSSLGFRAAMAFSQWPTVPVRDTVDAGLQGLLEAALSVVGPDDLARRAILLSRLAQSYRWSADQQRGEELLAEACELADASRCAEAEMAVLLARRLLMTGPGRGKERLALTDRLTAEVEGGSSDLMLVLFLRFADQLEVGDLTGATATVGRQLDVAERGGGPGAWWFAVRNQASLALLSGHLDRAQKLADAALVYGLRAQHPRARVSHEIELLHLRLARGELEQSLPYWREAAPSAPWHLATHAWIEALAGAADLARTAAEEVLALDATRMPASANWLPTIMALGNAVAALAWAEPVEALWPLLASYEGCIVTIFNGVVCLGATDLLLGRLAAITGDLSAAEHHLQRAIAAHDRLGAVLLAGESRAEYARILRERGRAADAVRAAQLAGQAAAAFRARGALRLLDLVPEPSSHPPTSSVPPAGGLSARELEVLRLLALGLTNKDIAVELHISAATVQRHTINLYRKLGVNGRSQAAAYAARHLAEPT